MSDRRPLLFALPLAFLLHMVIVPTGGGGVIVAPLAFGALIGLDLCARLALAAWGLRSFVRSGATQPLVLAVGLLGFVGFYVWRFLLAAPEQPEVSGFYGSLARAVFAVVLLNVVGFGVVGADDRRRLAFLGVAIAVGLSLLAWTLRLSVLALGGESAAARPAQQLFEGTAAVLTLAAAARVLRGRGTAGSPRVDILLSGLALTAEQSVFLATAEPWSARWWTGRLVGLTATALMGWAVLQSTSQGGRAAGSSAAPTSGAGSRGA